MGIGLFVLGIAGMLHEGFPEMYKRKLKEKLVVTSLAQVGRLIQGGREGGREGGVVFLPWLIIFFVALHALTSLHLSLIPSLPSKADDAAGWYGNSGLHTPSHNIIHFYNLTNPAAFLAGEVPSFDLVGECRRWEGREEGREDAGGLFLKPP